MSEEVIWQLEIDGSGSVASIDEIAASIDVLLEKIAQVATAASDTSVLDEALASVSASAADATAATDGMAEALATMSQQANEDTATISALNDTIINLEAQIAMLTVEESSASEEAGVLASALSTMGEMATSAGDALQAAMGPLMMIVAAAGMAGGALAQMGMDGQKGEALLTGMAGASTADITALQQEALKLGVNMKDASAGFYMVESAGYSGAQAITVFDSAMKLAEGGQAQASDVMTGLTAIMHDYGASAQDSTKYTDIMRQAVFQGKQSMQDFATSIGPLAAAGAKAGMSFQEVAAAEATMTQINPHVRQDTQQLASLFDTLDPKMGKVAATAKTLKISFDENHYASLDLQGKLQYLAQIAGGETTPAFAKLVGGVRGATAATDILQGKAGTFIADLHAMKNAGGATENAFKSWESTVPAALDHVGAAFSVLATKAMDAIGPKIAPIIDKFSETIGSFTDFVSTHFDQLMPVVAGLAAMIGGTLAAAIAAFVGPMLVAAAPVLAVVAAIGLLVAGAVALVQHWDQVVQSIKNFAPPGVFDAFINAAKGVWQFLVDTFQPVWKQLQDVYNSQIRPAVEQLVVSFKQMMPILQPIAILIGGMLVVAVGLLVGAIGGFVRGMAGMISGLAVAFGGVVQMISGVVQTVTGIVQFIVDLFTGHFDKLGGDLKNIFGGISNIFSGFGNVAKGIAEGIVKGVTGEFSGMADGVIGYFNNIVHGVGNATQQTKDKALQNSMEMKDQQIKNAEQTDLQTVQKYDKMRLGIIDQLSKTKDAAARHTLEMKLDTVTKSEGQAQAVLQKHAQMRVGVESELDKLKKGTADRFQTIQKDTQNVVGNVGNWLKDRWNDISHATTDTLQKMGDGIKNAVSTAVNWLKDRWNDAVHAVINAFQWMYDHNYYWKAACDEIRHVVEEVMGWLKNAWETVKRDVSAAWNTVSKTVSDIAEGIKNNIQAAITAAMNWLAGAWENVKKTATDAWNTLAKGAEDVWTRISQPFKDAWSKYISPALTSLWNSVTNTWNGFVSQASQFGANVVKAIANGITSAASSVSQAATGVANNIKNILGFHSPTKEGPGSTSDQWAPALMNMFISGIEGSQSRLRQAVANTAQIVAGMQTQIASSVTLSAGAGSGALPSLSPMMLPTNLQNIGGLGNNQATALLAQILSALLTQQGGGNSNTNINMQNNISAPNVGNAQQMYNLLQSLGGYGYEGILRSGTGM